MIQLNFLISLFFIGSKIANLIGFKLEIKIQPALIFYNISLLNIGHFIPLPGLFFSLDHNIKNLTRIPANKKYFSLVSWVEFE